MSLLIYNYPGSDKSNLFAEIFKFKRRHSNICFQIAKSRTSYLSKVDGYVGYFLSFYACVVCVHDVQLPSKQTIFI